ncbi:MAG: OmpA family protein [Kofleriaceae bacterium]
MKIARFALLLAFATACSHDKPKVAEPTTVNQEKPAADTKQLAQVPTNTQVSPNLALSGDIMQMCGIKAAATAAPPQFDYNKDELTPDDRTVLDQLATCMMTGALKGKAVSLIGRADPRGTEEYNLSLGSRRAGSVSSYLEHLGVQQGQLAVTTRGALDATGTDDSGWQKDRRVDVMLKVD